MKTITDAKEFFDDFIISEIDYNDIYNLYYATTGEPRPGFDVLPANNSDKNLYVECPSIDTAIILTPESAELLRQLIDQKFVKANDFSNIDSFWSWHREMEKND